MSNNIGCQIENTASLIKLDQIDALIEDNFITVSHILSFPPDAPDAFNDGPLCTGQTLNLTASTVAGATYEWSGPNGFVSNIQNPSIPSVTTDATGMYSVTVSVSGCASLPAITTVTINFTPLPAISDNSPVCPGETLNLTATLIPGATYTWTGPNGFNASPLNTVSIPNVTTEASGTYSVIVTNGCGSNAATTTVTITDTPAPTVSSNSPICMGQTLNLTAGALSGATYSWAGPLGFVANVQNPTVSGGFLPLTPGTYTYSVVATQNGCPVAVVKVLPDAIANPTITSGGSFCQGAPFQLTSSPAGMIYAWSGPAGFTSNVQNPTVSGGFLPPAGPATYTLTITNGVGCTASSTHTVTIKPLPTATVQSNAPLCVGQTLQLTGGPGGAASYLWLGPSFTSNLQSPSIIHPTAGTYTLTVKGFNGCITKATTTVVISPIPVPTVTSNSPLCTGSTLNLTAGFISGATYLWTAPNGFTSTSRTPSIPNVSTLANGVYSLVVTVPGCSASKTLPVTVSVRPMAGGGTLSVNPVCAGGTLNLIGSSTIMGSTFQWTGPNSFSSTLQSPVISNVTTANAGSYILTVKAPSPNNCVSLPFTINVSVANTPTSTVNNNGPLCSGQTLNLSSTVSTPVFFNWTGPCGLTSTSQTPIFQNIASNCGGTYSLTVTTTNNCTASATTNVVVNPAVNATAANNGPICLGQTLQLTGGPTITGATYTWNLPFGGTLNGQNQILGNAIFPGPGVYTYTLTITTGSCPPASATTALTVNVCKENNLSLNSDGAKPFNAIIYPNPATERINVELRNEEEKDVYLEIFNANGKRLHKQTLQKNNEINAAEWAEGVYLFRFIHNGITIETKKVILNR